MLEQGRTDSCRSCRGEPWQLMWSRRFAGLGGARRFENLLKKQKDGNGFYRLTGLTRDT